MTQQQKIERLASRIGEQAKAFLQENKRGKVVMFGARINIKLTKNEEGFVVTSTVFVPKKRAVAYRPLTEKDKAIIRKARLSYRQEVELLLDHGPLNSEQIREHMGWAVKENFTWRNDTDINTRFSLLGLPYRVRRINSSVRWSDDPDRRWNIFRQEYLD